MRLRKRARCGRRGTGTFRRDRGRRRGPDGGKALTVAIAGALAAPLAAQAVDFTISGHVNRALVVVDNDMGTDAAVVNNGSSSTRIRWTGSSEMMDGTSIGIQVEYQESGTRLGLRHANIHYGGEFGKVTIGQGSEAGDASAYSDPSGVFGIGHGQEKGSSMLGGYFGSLDAGTRTNMIRYDTPSIGPLSAAVSIGNGDRVSAKLALGTEFNGTSFSAQVATLQEKGDSSTVGASFGASMASGFTVSGAWAKGESMGGSAATPDTVTAIGCVDNSGDAVVHEPVPTGGDAEGALTCPAGSNDAFQTMAGTAAMPPTDPSYFQASIGYKFGNTAVAASWYSSEDFKMMGSEGTAIGIGVNHNLPKVGAQVYAAVQNYDVNMSGDGGSMMDMMDDTVFVVGTRVKF